MRLSEAIRLGAMNAPQAFEVYVTSDGDMCAIAGAFHAVGERPDVLMHAVVNFPMTFEHYPLSRRSRCPHGGCPAESTTAGMVMHLNDYHRWSRERIADFVATLEPPVELPEVVDAPDDTVLVTA